MHPHHIVYHLAHHPHIAMAIDGDVPRFSFQTHRTVEWERSTRWWVIFGTVMVSSMLIFAFTGQLFMTGMLWFIAFGYVYAHRTPSPMIWVTLSHMGVYYNEKFLSYSDIENFTMSHPVPGMNILHLNLRHRFGFLEGKQLDILILDQNVLKIRDFMLEQVLEYPEQKIGFWKTIQWILKL